jgi:3-methyladenine DNA glycosylase AlkD
MHREHRKLLQQLRSLGDPPRRARDGDQNDSYGSSGRIFYWVPVPARRRIAREWTRQHATLGDREVLAVVESLFSGESHEEKTLAALLLSYCPSARGRAGPVDVDRWLGQLNGWAEVDGLCQGVFTAEELLGQWRPWRDSIRRFARHGSANHRRAALVLLTGPVRRSEDPRLRDLAFELIERLKHERIILISKAISWLLRSLVAHHRQAVLRYLDENATTLPKIALRETRIKLATGRKTRAPARKTSEQLRP